MAEATTTVAPEQKPKRAKLPSLTVKRNDIDLVFADAEVLRGKKNKGKAYLKPSVTEENLESAINWIGRKFTSQYIDAFLRQRSQGWFFEAMEEATDKDSGAVDQEKLSAAFTKLATDFSARGDSIPTLKKQIEELTDEMTSLDVDNEEPTVAIAAVKRFKEIAAEIKELQLAISLKRRKDDDEDENDKK